MKIKSMAVNILTLYKFNGKFISKININYLLCQVPSGSCIKHLSDSVGYCSEVLSVCQSFLEMVKPSYLCRENIYFTSKTRKRLRPFSSSVSRLWQKCSPVFHHWNSKLLRKGRGDVILLLSHVLLTGRN